MTLSGIEVLVVLVVVGSLIYARYFYREQSHKNADAVDHNRDLIVKCAAELDEKTNLATLLTMTLIKIHGSKKAALIYMHMLDNNLGTLTIPTKKALYRKYDIPEEYADTIEMLVAHGNTLDWDVVKKKIEEYDKKTLRLLTADFENLEETMKELES